MTERNGLTKIIGHFVLQQNNDGNLRLKIFQYFIRLIFEFKTAFNLFGIVCTFFLLLLLFLV